MLPLTPDSSWILPSVSTAQREQPLLFSGRWGEWKKNQFCKFKWKSIVYSSFHIYSSLSSVSWGFRLCLAFSYSKFISVIRNFPFSRGPPQNDLQNPMQKVQHDQHPAILNTFRGRTTLCENDFRVWSRHRNGKYWGINQSPTSRLHREHERTIALRRLFHSKEYLLSWFVSFFVKCLFVTFRTYSKVEIFTLPSTIYNFFCLYTLCLFLSQLALVHEQAGAKSRP